MTSRPRSVIRGVLGLLLAALTFVVLLGLGFWQLERREWKHTLTAEIEARGEAMPLDSAAAIDAVPPGERPFHHVRLTATPLAGQGLALLGRSHNGQPGYGVITPLRLDDGSILLAEEGWIPMDRFDAGDWRIASVEPVTAVGVLRAPDSQDGLAPQNKPEAGQWLRMVPAEMTPALNLQGEQVRQLWLRLDAPIRQADPPQPLPGQPELRDDHLQYALTWFSLAGLLVILMITLLVKRRRPQ